jgi:hypothetical protein
VRKLREGHFLDETPKGAYTRNENRPKGGSGVVLLAVLLGSYLLSDIAALSSQSLHWPLYVAGLVLGCADAINGSALVIAGTQPHLEIAPNDVLPPLETAIGNRYRHPTSGAQMGVQGLSVSLLLYIAAAGAGGAGGAAAGLLLVGGAALLPVSSLLLLLLRLLPC